jgi:protein phosphatase
LDAEIFEIEPANNDRFILCSDGLTDLISDDEIQQMVVVEDEPENLCRKFIDKALTRGGHDNTTVVSVFLTGIEKQKPGPIEKIGSFFGDVFPNSQKPAKKN